MLNHGARSEIALIEEEEARCYCIGSSSEPAASGAPTLECLPVEYVSFSCHSGFAVIQLTDFIRRGRYCNQFLPGTLRRDFSPPSHLHSIAFEQ